MTPLKIERYFNSVICKNKIQVKQVADGKQ